ncbi:O-antigen ligase family protein [Pseudohalioglobus sediminis]|uniref:O-antigen ligase family protein n=1 Tax=Pseudohalioglobus sediminis TaxID=2606449 RepID=A0A5B0WRT9_9GAMM|nr:O-antigen ligase family protein [Pseudohalioglobus sediminis]KAA1188951.1 O-antigen ligase family protein [Pseudohalioglobus sediminis]
MISGQGTKNIAAVAAPTKHSALEGALFAAFMAILVWAPLPFASNREWAGSLLTLLLAAVAAAWVALWLAGRAQVHPRIWRRAKVPLYILLAVQAWVLLQITPLPPAVIEALSPRAAAWHVREGWLTLSLDWAATHYYLLRGCGITLGFFLMLALVNSERRVRLFLQVLVFSGTAQAAYGAFMVLSGLELGFFVEKYAGRGVATGTFVNRNHLAGYLVMCLAAGTGLLLSQLSRQRIHGWKERLRSWLRLLLSPKFRLRLYLAVMVVALVLTRSRMGNVAFFSALALAGCVALYSGRRFSWRMVGFLASLFVVDMIILGRWFGLDKLVERLEGLEGKAAEEFSRYWMDFYTLDYIRAFPFTGSGGGSFYGIFPNFQGEQLRGFYLHSHNDYLEFSAELGLPAALALVAFVALCLWQAVQVQRKRHHPLYRGAGFAVTMAVIWAAIHSTVDFNLQIPANALTFVSLLALAYISGNLPRNKAL